MHNANHFSVVGVYKWRNNDRARYIYLKSGDFYLNSLQLSHFGLTFRKLLHSYSNHYTMKLRQRNLNQEQLHHCELEWLIIDLDLRKFGVKL
jgi:hypothetical protein